MTPKLRSRFLLLRQLAGMPDVTLRIGRAVEFPRKRDYAYCHLRDDGRIAIVVAPKIRRASIARIDGLLTHEFGHAAHFAAGRIEHSERAADAAAERLFGVRISYDRDDVQTTDLGLRPRPARLDRPGRRKNGDRDKLVRHLRSHCGMTAEDADKVAPTKSVKSSRRALSPEQQTVFVSTVHRVVADPGPRTILLLLLATGMRIAECYNLPLAAFVTTPRGRLKADVLGKGSKLRTVSMTRRGSSLIREYVKRYRVGGSGHLFTGPRGGKVTPRQVQLACKSVADAMGVRGLTPHVLRHSYASTQVLNCRDLQSLRMQLGHGKLDTPRKKLRRLPLVTLTYLDF
jgi:integrase